MCFSNALTCYMVMFTGICLCAVQYLCFFLRYFSFSHLNNILYALFTICFAMLNILSINFNLLSKILFCVRYFALFSSIFYFLLLKISASVSVASCERNITKFSQIRQYEYITILKICVILVDFFVKFHR